MGKIVETGVNGTMGQRIAYARAKAGKKQHEIAERLGISIPAVSEWETGKNEPYQKHLIKLAEYLDCSVLWLFAGNENPIARVEARYLEVPVNNRNMALEDALRTLARWVEDDLGNEKKPITKALAEGKPKPKKKTPRE